MLQIIEQREMYLDNELISFKCSDGYMPCNGQRMKSTCVQGRFLDLPSCKGGFVLYLIWKSNVSSEYLIDY